MKNLKLETVVQSGYMKRDEIEDQINAKDLDIQNFKYESETDKNKI